MRVVGGDVVGRRQSSNTWVTVTSRIMSSPVLASLRITRPPRAPELRRAVFGQLLRDLPGVAAGSATVSVRCPSRSPGPMMVATCAWSNSACTASTSSTKMTNCPTPFCARLSTSPDGPS